MAIRYSGDVEVRVQQDSKGYRGSIRAPSYRRSFSIPAKAVGRTPPDLSLAYDRVAVLVLEIVESHRHRLPTERDKNGNLIVRRMFQSACPS